MTADDIAALRAAGLATSHETLARGALMAYEAVLQAILADIRDRMGDSAFHGIRSKAEAFMTARLDTFRAEHPETAFQDAREEVDASARGAMDGVFNGREW